MRAARWMAFTVLCACASSKTQEIQTTQETHTSGRETTATVTVTTRTEGPERITTTIEEFTDAGGTGPGVLLRGPPAQRESPAVTSAEGARAATHAPFLVKRTVTVAERGPILTESHATASGASETSATGVATAKASTKEESRPAAGCALGLGFYAALALCVILVLAWKLRKIWLPWL